MSTQIKKYNLGVGLRTLDGDPISPLALQITPTRDEYDPKTMVVTSDAYKAEPCPAWRAIKHCLMAHPPDENGKPKRLEEAEMHERFELAYNIMYAVRNNDGVIGLTNDDVARIKTAAAGIYMIEPYGVLAKALDLAVQDEVSRRNGASQSTAAREVVEAR